MEAEDHSWEQRWREMLQLAARRPTMFIGSQDQGHRYPISDALKLVGKAQAFSHPVRTIVALSPTQYVVRCESGPLLPAIEKLIEWKGKRVLTDEWNGIGEKIMDGRTRRPLKGWRYAFTGPIGPRLGSPTNPVVFAHRLIYGVRTRAGLRCQAFEAGWPTSVPFIITDPSPMGLITAAALDSQWYTGLPFGEREVEAWGAMPNVSVQWHPQDDLLDDLSMSPDGVRQWL